MILKIVVGIIYNNESSKVDYDEQALNSSKHKKSFAIWKKKLFNNLVIIRLIDLLKIINQEMEWYLNKFFLIRLFILFFDKKILY